MFNKTNEMLDRCIEVGTPAFHMVVHQGSKKVFERKYGVKNSDGDPIVGDELYNIYSCSKPITCAAALTLLEDGKISLADPVAEYIPAFADMKVKCGGSVVKAQNRMTLYHLFTMTSGLNYNVDHEAVRCGIAETEGRAPTVKMMDYIAKIPLEFEPGGSWWYGLSHDVLAAVVEVVSGEDFDTYVRRRIFDPLGMKSATYKSSDVLLASMPDRYLFKDGVHNIVSKRNETYVLGLEYQSGGAGCICSVSDYVKFLDGLKDGRIISKDTLEIMTKDQLNDMQRAVFGKRSEGYSYGLGVRTPVAGEGRTDFGWDGAAGAYQATDIGNDITVFYAQHVCASPVEAFRCDFIEAVKADILK